MSNFKNKSIFSKKQGFNLFIFIGVVVILGALIYFTSNSFSDSTTVKTNSNVAQNNGFDNELNTNDGYIDNAIQVKDDGNNLNDINKSTSNVATSDYTNVIVDNTDTSVFDDTNDVSNNANEGLDVAMDVNEDSSNLNENAPVSATTITFSSPVDGSLIREYTTDTIYSKTLNTWRTREGVDLKADKGTPVVSVLDGVVEKIDNDLTERGQYIVIKHDDGFKSVYTNLDDEVKVVNGQKVRKGEIIGTVGNTSGNYSNEDYGTHLNFIMYLNNEEVNPADYINFK